MHTLEGVGTVLWGRSFNCSLVNLISMDLADKCDVWMCQRDLY